MALERRVPPVQLNEQAHPRRGKKRGSSTKSFEIRREAVLEAWQHVKANRGAAGIDQQSINDVEADLDGQLYKLWNRLSSGSYQPPPVRQVAIAKSDGGVRYLGIPTVMDRVAQTVVKHAIEPELEKHFHPDSYGYRPGRSAHDALAVTRERCWQQHWVVDIDIKGFFDTIDHDLLNLALDRHVTERWHRLMIQRWLTAPMQDGNGKQEPRHQGTPQGGVISPLLANLFLHYVFDRWMDRHWPGIRFARYADDIVCHCETQAEAEALLSSLAARFEACKLRMHPEKSKIVYCRNGVKDPVDHPHTQFDFLGYTFRDRTVRTGRGQLKMGFTPAISRKAQKRLRGQVRQWQLAKQSHRTIEALAEAYRGQIRGWKQYYGRYTASALAGVWWYLENRLIRWVRNKYGKRIRSDAQAARWLNRLRQSRPNLFPQWR